jgi:response regulator of citrate/malate metabolism
LAAHDFELIANAVAIGVVDAIACAVVMVVWIGARSRIRCVRIVVSSGVVLAAHDFEFIANAVAIGVVDALTRAVIVGVWIGA